MPKLLVLLLIVVQITIIGFLLQNISKLKSGVKGISISANPQKKDDYLKVLASNKLNFFYELKPSYIRKDRVPSSEEEVLYKINSESLNEEREYKNTKDPDVFRIVTLGDSFTFGLFVNPTDNYTKKLEKKLNENPICHKWSRYEVINLGVPGYDIQYALERFKRRGQKLDPDLLVWLVKYDDFFQINEIINPRSEEIKSEMIKSGEQQILEKKGNYYEYVVRARNEFLNKVKTEDILEKQIIEIGKINNYFKNTLLLFSLGPNTEVISKSLAEYSETRQNTFYFEGISDLNPNQLLTDGHPNSAGHDFIAQNLYEYIVTNRIIPCNYN